MPVTPSSAYIAELRKGTGTPTVRLEVELDSGTVRWGTHLSLSDEVRPLLKSVTSLQNRLDPQKNWSTRGELVVVIGGVDIPALIAAERLKNRRVTRYDGFTSLAYADYAGPTFTGKISNWENNPDGTLTLTIADDLAEASKEIPVENAADTQYLDYRNMHPMDIMEDMALTRLGIPSAFFNSAKFAFEGETWLNGWVFDRVLTEPKEANRYLNELQVETNSFVIHDGAQISCKVFAPPLPSESIEEWDDQYNVKLRSMLQKSGYKDRFYNAVLVRYDYNEAGGDSSENFDSGVLAVDAASQTQWGETSLMTIYSKWIRSATFTESNVSGLKVYLASKANGAGAGSLVYTAATNSLAYTAPGDAAGEAVKLSKDGKFQVFSADKTKYVRVLVTPADLPGGDATDTITIAALSGEQYATTLARKILGRYRDPASIVSFEVGLINAVYDGAFIKPTDLKDLSTPRAFEFGEAGWDKERLMLTSVRLDGNKVKLEGIETKMYLDYIYIAPAGYPDAPSATPEQKKRWFIGDANNKINGGTEDGRYIW